MEIEKSIGFLDSVEECFTNSVNSPNTGTVLTHVTGQ